MPTWIAFLRGMNLGGRRLTNDELTAAVETSGADDVRPYLASGNVVLNHDETEQAVVRDLLQRTLSDELGYDVPCFVRSPDELRVLLDDEPFDAAALDASDGKPQVVFLHEPPSDPDTVLALAPEGDRLLVRGRELRWLPAAGLSDNDLDLTALDRATGGTTVRTENTVRRLVTKFLR